MLKWKGDILSCLLKLWVSVLGVLCIHEIAMELYRIDE